MSSTLGRHRGAAPRGGPGLWGHRAVPAQAALAPNWVEAIPYCEAGCQVDIHVQQPGMALTLTGKALERGYADRPLRVRLYNGGTMQAWYDKDGQLSDRRTP